MLKQINALLWITPSYQIRLAKDLERIEPVSYTHLDVYKRQVLKREQYCFDPHFVDRVDERNLLYAFLQADGSTDNRLFVVKGGMCRGKTVLLQRFADDVNGFYNDQIHRKRGLLRKKYSACLLYTSRCV